MFFVSYSESNICFSLSFRLTNRPIIGSPLNLAQLKDLAPIIRSIRIVHRRFTQFQLNSFIFPSQILLSYKD